MDTPRTEPAPVATLRPLALAALALALLATLPAPAAASCQGAYTQYFRTFDCTWADTGTNPFFPLEPGRWSELRGNVDGELVELRISVLFDTETVAGVVTRVVEEREWVDGELAEVSRNFFAVCEQTGNVFYFGEDVDIYEDGQVVSHDGAWRAGIDGARPGVFMPGSFLLGARYFQEIAPQVALDRACNTRMALGVWTPAGSFSGCVQVDETTPLEPDDLSIKRYCPGVGLVYDDGVRLIDWSERSWSRPAGNAELREEELWRKAP
jgi:hypothetical protein